jgi:hypothetical protein
VKAYRFQLQVDFDPRSVQCSGNVKVHKLVTIRLSEADHQKLQDVLSKDEEQSFSALIRRLIRRRHKTLFNPNLNKMTLSAPGLRGV